MAWARGASIVAEAEIVDLVGEQDLAKLEATAEFDRAKLLITASDAIYDQLDADGVDPTTITNETVYKRAVAWHFLAILVIRRYCPPPEGRDPPANPFEWSDPFYAKVRPRTTASDNPRTAGEGVPAVGNVTRRALFDTSNTIAGEVFGDLPTPM